MKDYDTTDRLSSDKYQFIGKTYTENKMCLYKSFDTERLCVNEMPFFSPNLDGGIIGNFEAQGILGLAPTNDEKSYINQLFDNG